MRTAHALRTDHSGMRRVVAGERLELAAKGCALESIKQSLNCGQTKCIAMKNEVILLAAQANEIKAEGLSGGACGDATVGLAGQHSMRGGQMPERGTFIPANIAGSHGHPLDQCIQKCAASRAHLA